MPEETLNNNFQKKISNFIKSNLKNLIILFIFLILLLFGYFFYEDVKKRNGIKISESYTQATIKFKKNKVEESKEILENIINKDHRFYSPMALYFIIDNNLENDALKIVKFFDKILSINSIDQENLNLIKIKKAIFLFNSENEEDVITTLNPIINSESIWRNIAINLMADYFLSKNQKTKANEYFQLLNKKIKK
jgi:predicted negative regulator of RcsB-dependent stress response